MFGPSKEVQKIIDDTKLLIGKNWKIFEEQGPEAFLNSEFLGVILSWRDESHPTKFFGGFKHMKIFSLEKTSQKKKQHIQKKHLSKLRMR